MGSLSSSLSIAVQSLNAASGSLQATNNNIANANTPGYTREVPILAEMAPVSNGNFSAGTGVDLEGYQSVRDELLQTQIEQETQAQSGANAQLASLQQIQPTFTTSTQDIGTEMSALFSSISSLSTDPTNSTSQEAVLTAGQNLATAFNTASSTLTAQQTGLNAQVSQDVSQINQLAQQIAALNPQIAQLKGSVQDGGTLQDQQDQLVLQLSALTSVSVTQGDDGETLTTGNGTPLVVGSQPFALQTATGSDGMTRVLDQNGTDITSSLTGGDLGGTIQTRDTTIPGLLSQLDTLANQFGAAFNTTQAMGYDQNGNKGGEFFTLPATPAPTIPPAADLYPGAAANIKMAITDPTQIAASSVGTAIDNLNLAKFSAISTTSIVSGQTPGNAYASIVYQVGSLTSNANAESTATTASLAQLNNQLSSASGVSIDEESANLITYQQAYEAAARVVTTIQALFAVTMTMGTAAAE
ncbi:MAG: flagellar hook-associated protein FlgK [Terracidiphilus sp.]|jgi:flagellar hook-associated protein 1 FlgK